MLRLAAAVRPRVTAMWLETTQLTGRLLRRARGVNGDYFAYDWSGAAVPYGPLVAAAGSCGCLRRAAAGRLGRAGRPIAAGVRAAGSLSAGRGNQRWSLPVGSVNDEGDGAADTAADAVRAGRAVAVVTPWLGTARPTRLREVVVRRGRVVAVGHRLSFGAGRTFGSGSAGRRDVLFAASGHGGRELARPAPGHGGPALVPASRRARGGRPVQAVGSGAAMLRGGRVLLGCPGSAALSRPRTLIAWNADRTRLWLVTVDGRAGPRRPGLPVRAHLPAGRGRCARSLGATEAVMLDGGGSTTMAVEAPTAGCTGSTRPPAHPQRPVPDGSCSSARGPATALHLDASAPRARRPVAAGPPAARTTAPTPRSTHGQQHRRPPVVAVAVEEHADDRRREDAGDAEPGVDQAARRAGVVGRDVHRQRPDRRVRQLEEEERGGQADRRR